MARGFSRGGRSGGGGGGGFSFGGGGGGFRAGFGSSGSSYNRGGSSYGHSHHTPRGPRRPWRMHFFGRTVILAGPAQTLLSLLLGVFIFSIVFFAGLIGNMNDNKAYMAESKEMIAKYEEYDEIFSTIIERAENGDEGYYIVNATFENRKFTTYGDDPTLTGYYLTDYYEKGEYYYFVVYEFEYHANDTVGQSKYDKTWNDSTFIEFTTYGVRDLSGTIEVAYTRVDGEVWAINTSYTLERNKDYQVEKDYLADLEENKGSYVKMLVITGVVIAVIVLIAVLFIKRKYKQAKKDQAVQDAKNEAEIAEARANAELAEAKASQIGRTCKHCGTDVPDGATICPACGSRHFEKD